MYSDSQSESSETAQADVEPRPLTIQPTQTHLLTYQLRNLTSVPGIQYLTEEQRHDIRVVGQVFPFKVNNYVCEQLIDWSAVPDDPIYRLTFPHRDMLDHAAYDHIDGLVRARAPQTELRAAAQDIQRRLNPHPSGQSTDNVPKLNGRPIPGMQHKYRETVLFFPSRGQTCHSYCTYCFRWPQFVDLDQLKFSTNDVDDLVAYLRSKPDIKDILFTGGDPLIMSAAALRRYLEPLMAPEFEGLRIRIGTKALAFWPYLFTEGEQADELLRLFEAVVESGRHLAIMAHYSHPRELSTKVAQNALRRVTSTGAVVRCQSPLIRHVNDRADDLAALWQTQVDLGAVPYYMFVERDTGARQYFEVPLAQVLSLFQTAFGRMSGLGRTIRGPVMSAQPGKVVIEDVIEVAGEKAFVCKLLQSRVPELANRIFFARFDEKATWFDQLQPALGTSRSWFPHLTPA